MTRRIPPQEWSDFLAGFTRQHRDWLVTVTTDRPDAIDNWTAPRELPALQHITWNQPQRTIDIALGGRNAPPARQGPQRLTIANPRTLDVEQSRQGAETALHIASDISGLTTLRFRVAVLPELVDGILESEV